MMYMNEHRCNCCLTLLALLAWFVPPPQSPPPPLPPPDVARRDNGVAHCAQRHRLFVQRSAVGFHAHFPTSCACSGLASDLTAFFTGPSVRFVSFVPLHCTRNLKRNEALTLLLRAVSWRLELLCVVSRVAKQVVFMLALSLSGAGFNGCNRVAHGVDQRRSGITALAQGMRDAFFSRNVCNVSVSFNDDYGGACSEPHRRCSGYRICNNTLLNASTMDNDLVFCCWHPNDH